MSTDHDALFRAVCADHEEDTPRLAFADWFDENDQPERAAFIRRQIEFDHLMRDGSDSQAVYEFLVERDYVTKPAAKWEKIDAGIARRLQLAQQLADAWNGFKDTWTAVLPRDCGVEWKDFHRGFPGGAIVTDIELMAESAARLRAVSPPVELVCSGLTADEAERLIEADLLPWIRGLEIEGECADGLRTLGRHPAASGIRRLTIHGSDYSNGTLMATALSGPPHWTGLRYLDLGPYKGLDFTADAAEILFRAEHLRGLRVLRMKGSHWNAGTMRVFAEAAFPNLTDLRFLGADLDSDAVEVLARTPCLGSVRYFDVARNRVSGSGATALLCSPHLRSMAFLGLEANPVRALDRQAIKTTPEGGLRLLHCHGCRLAVQDVAALVRSPRLRELWYLDFDANNLGASAAKEIVRGFKQHCPPVMWLTMNQLDDASATALANWPATENLRVLELSANRLTDAGVRALLESPYLKNLDGIGVPNVSQPLADAIKARFGDFGRIGKL